MTTDPAGARPRATHGPGGEASVVRPEGDVRSRPGTAVHRTWWRVADYAYAGWYQVRGVLAPGDPDRYAEPTARRAPDVVLVPGVMEPWPFLQPLAARLFAAGHAVHVVPGLGYHVQDLAEAVRTVAELLADRDLTDVVVVAHSKGGLVGKLLLADPGAGPRVRGLVAVATPFAGSRLARFLPLRSIRIFRPDHPDIVGLARVADVDRRIVSVFSRWDPHVPEGSVLAGARNVELETPGHFRVLADPRLPEVVLDAARAFVTPGPPGGGPWPPGPRAD
ncbi:esterase/lipase family protein [Cellulomonas fimi]|uniref:Putative lipase transmembrane protein n=1 Tax=Cellulomonas fimi (strain ATCC 484 / DSM 20113 / JCM 1341 / CCUG 24087 / LMG 16345 / NBRC 15513 / NCIMB 8980 / NCTC 7547 / NRS-133) TaxID=590998 RepID=F4H5Y4_CELFA|nr:lipase [Cellulomonas fimi]AEE46714.1 putative lipase transmembrane protein [Cellulomonas fimi ATCC 484]VEH33964.1 Predicted esterase of the alpha/beta hydrolase fold [Cellulomonas fimi]